MLQFFTTAAYPCSYLPGQMARSMMAAPAGLVDNEVYARLLTQGFRRSGGYTYKPACDSCRACIPVRVDCARFAATRSQRRGYNKFAPLLNTELAALKWRRADFDLYEKYLQARHPDSSMNQDSEAQYRDFLLQSNINSAMLRFTDGAGVLRIVALMDILPGAASAVYTFYDPSWHSGLGTYAVLRQIRFCQQAGLAWLYLGYWIAASPKMAYKAAFKPQQILLDGAWSENP